MSDGDIHVVSKGDEWHVTVEGSGNLSTFDTQADAIDAGRTAARAAKRELLIHAEDGTIRERDSYGNDPSDRPG